MKVNSIAGMALAKPDRTPPSLTAATVCALASVRILRMRDVPAAVGAARMTEVILGLWQPTELRHHLDELSKDAVSLRLAEDPG